MVCDDHQPKGPLKMQSYWLDVDASKARKLLSGSQTKRSQSNMVIAQYARDMVAGRFPPTHQGIAIDCHDVLVDGGHRMSAVLLADQERPGVTVRFWVTRYDEPASVLCAPGGVFDVWDSGRIRTISHVLEAEGHSDYTQKAAITRRIIACAAGTPWTMMYRPSKQEQLAWIETVPGITEAARYAHSKAVPPRTIMSPAAAGFCSWLFSRTAEEKEAAAFMTKLASGENLEARSALLVLRTRLLSGNLSHKQPGATRRTELRIALTIRAWNRHLEGGPVEKLQHGVLSDETYPLPFGLTGWRELRQASWPPIVLDAQKQRWSPRKPGNVLQDLYWERLRVRRIRRPCPRRAISPPSAPCRLATSGHPGPFPTSPTSQPRPAHPSPD